MTPSEIISVKYELCLVMKDLRIRHANAMPSPYVAGLPSMYGVVGFAQKLIHQVLSDCELSFVSVAISISQFNMTGSQQKYPCYLKSDLKKHQSIRIISDRTSCFTASVIIKVNSKLNHKQLATWIDDNQNLDGLYNLRLCGGWILYPEGQPNLKLYHPHQLPELILSFRGFMIADSIHLCRSEKHWGEDSLDTLLRVIKESPEKHNGWLVPLAVGYKAFGPLMHRRNSRAELEHSFCDPILGLGHLQRASFLTDSQLLKTKLFWKPAKLEYLVEATI